MSHSPKKIYFGGSFFPPHMAHTEMIQSAFLRDSEAELILVPTHQNPLKESPGSSLELMQAWLEDLADILSYQQFSRLTLDLTEFDKEEKSYTLDTLLELQRPNEKWVLFLGSDSAKTFARWKEPQKILQLICEIWIVPRNNEKALEEIKNNFIAIDPHATLHFLDPVTQVSSSSIRNGTTSQPLSELLSPRVLSVWKQLSL